MSDEQKKLDFQIQGRHIVELSSEVKFLNPEFGPSPFCNNHLDLFRKMPDLAQSFKPGIYRKFTSSVVTIPGARILTRNLNESVGIVHSIE
jgi:hypothetical protein